MRCSLGSAKIRICESVKNTVQQILKIVVRRFPSVGRFSMVVCYSCADDFVGVLGGGVVLHLKLSFLLIRSSTDVADESSTFSTT